MTEFNDERGGRTSGTNPRPRPHLESSDAMCWFDGLRRVREPGPGPARDDTGWALATSAVHAGQMDDPRVGAVGTPIYQNTTFTLSEDSYQSIEDGWARDRFIYSRYGNPSQWAVQQKLSTVEGAESAVVFSSGMAAITTTLLALLDRGAHIVTSRDLYGGTYNLFHEDLPQWGFDVSFVDPTDVTAIEAAIRADTTLLYFEALTNPLLKLVPLPEVAALARRHHCRVVIDNTFLSPVNLRPLDHGVDVVVHSASKYLNGHSDLIAGAAAGSRKLVDRIWGQMLKQGGSLDPHACFLLERGLKTLAVRIRAHNENAGQVARFLDDRSEVRRVYYPGLASSDQFTTAAGLLDGFGGMISFELDGSDSDADRFVRHLNIPKVATSLGGVESLVSLPHNTSHASLMSPQRQAIGINPGLIRLSVGIEDPGDLIADLSRALSLFASGVPELQHA